MATTSQEFHGSTHTLDHLQLTHECMRGGESPVVGPGARRTLPGARADRVEHAVHCLAEKQVVDFLDVECQAEIPDEFGFDAAREIFAVDEHTIAIEDECRQACVAQTTAAPSAAPQARTPRARPDGDRPQ